MNRKLWLDDSRDKPCPNCHSGKLVYDSKNALSNETRQSLENNEHYKKGLVCPESNYLVSAHLKCEECGEVVVAVYERSEDVRHTDEDGNEISMWKSLLFHSAPHIIKVPASCSPSFKKHLIKSFGLFWYDEASCGNKIRVALETLLEDFGILSIDSNGKFVTLGKRLEQFAQVKPELKEFLNAIRLIGNSASHDDKLTKEDLLDAYDLIEHSLELLYREKETALISLAEKIKSNNGPAVR